MNKNIKVAKESVKLAKKISDKKSNDPSDFDNFKKHIMNVCENEIKIFQELYRFLQLNYDAPNQNIDVFDETDEIIKKIKNMYDKTSIGDRALYF